MMLLSYSDMILTKKEMLEENDSFRDLRRQWEESLVKTFRFTLGDYTMAIYFVLLEIFEKRYPSYHHL